MDRRPVPIPGAPQPWTGRPPRRRSPQISKSPQWYPWKPPITQLEKGQRQLSAHTSSVTLKHHFESASQQKEASTVGMWLFLVTEVMFFGGMFMAYIAYRHAYPHVFAEASQRLNIKLGLTNTIVLICSSLTMAMAVH